SHAQYHAKKFYEGLGFVQIGDSFEEVGIRYIYMEFFYSSIITYRCHESSVRLEANAGN
ncbi:MAG: hypothetical protein CMM37_01915, partial [Rhodospirillaceae bacterium]|nr:hypothetical protein [Rhodospirillaceae bacterium]